MFCVCHVHGKTLVCFNIYKMQAHRNNIRCVIGNSEERIAKEYYLKAMNRKGGIKRNEHILF